MILNVSRENISNGVNLNIVKTNKFKTNIISVYFVRPLNRNEVTKNALIPLVLKRGTKKYSSSLKLQRILEEHYGSNFSIDVNKKGERQVIRFSIETPSESIIGSDHSFKNIIKILYEIIHDPLSYDESFNEYYVNQEKENLKKRIESRINDKKQYAVERCIEEMCKNEKFSLYAYGYVEDLDDIDNINLYQHYKNILATSPVEICIVGNFDDYDYTKDIKNIFKFDRTNTIIVPRENIIKDIKTKNMVFEDLNVSQGKLTIGFRTNIPYESEKYSALLIASDILGGSSNSKLFKTVREKASLAYYIYTKMYKFKSIMLINSGIESDKFEETLDIIKKQVEELKSGIFKEEDIEKSKKSIITSIKSMTDNIYAVSEFIFSQVLTGDKRTIEEILNDIEKTNKKEIIESVSNLSMDTIYFLRRKKL